MCREWDQTDLDLTLTEDRENFTLYKAGGNGLDSEGWQDMVYWVAGQGLQSGLIRSAEWQDKVHSNWVLSTNDKARPLVTGRI